MTKERAGHYSGLPWGWPLTRAPRALSATAVSVGSTRAPMPSKAAALKGLEGPQERPAHQLVKWLLKPGRVAGPTGGTCWRRSLAMTGSVLGTHGGPRT